MKLEFQPISSIADVDEWLPFVEVLALFNGGCAIEDLDWDDGPLLTSLLEEITDVSLRADYEAEPTTGIQVAKDRFLSDLRERIAERRALLGDAYPFNLVSDGNRLIDRRPASDVSEAALAYLWLTLFWVVSSQSDYLVVTKNDQDGFIRNFARIFEYICCLVMVSRVPAVVWYFGDSRDVREFLRRLEGVVNTAGNGSVKPFNQLQENQTGANDAGVDVLAIPTHHNLIPHNATAYLIGATIQKTNRANKIFDQDHINRYRDYFLVGPKLAYQGVLAIPFEGTQIEELNCRDKNCGYIAKADILKILSDYPANSPRLQEIRSPRRKMRKKSRDLQATATLVNKGSALRIAWV